MATKEALYFKLYTNYFKPKGAFIIVKGIISVPKSTKEALADLIYSAY